MTEEQKLANVEHQVTFLERQVCFISCPYCGRLTPDGTLADCCHELSEAIAAVLHRKVIARQMEQADRIAQVVN